MREGFDEGGRSHCANPSPRNKCFTNYVQDEGGRYCLRGPMVQSDAEWLANKMNTQLS